MMTFKHKFVEYIPEIIDANTIYISIIYSTAIHLCACGCGNEVVTPLKPTDWELTFNGKNVSFYPSIGNWNFKCKSHYWIRKNEIIIASKWSEKKIRQNRESYKKENEDFFSDTKQPIKTKLSGKKSCNFKRGFLKLYTSIFKDL